MIRRFTDIGPKFSDVGSIQQKIFKRIDNENKNNLSYTKNTYVFKQINSYEKNSIGFAFPFCGMF